MEHVLSRHKKPKTGRASLYALKNKRKKKKRNETLPLKTKSQQNEWILTDL